MLIINAMYSIHNAEWLESTTPFQQGILFFFYTILFWWSSLGAFFEKYKKNTPETEPNEVKETNLKKIKKNDFKRPFSTQGLDIYFHPNILSVNLRFFDLYNP